MRIGCKFELLWLSVLVFNVNNKNNCQQQIVVLQIKDVFALNCFLCQFFCNRGLNILLLWFWSCMRQWHCLCGNCVGLKLGRVAHAWVALRSVLC